MMPLGNCILIDKNGTRYGVTITEIDCVDNNSHSYYIYEYYIRRNFTVSFKGLINNDVDESSLKMNHSVRLDGSLKKDNNEVL